MTSETFNSQQSNGTFRQISATLVSQGRLSNGRNANVWIEDAEWGHGKVTQTLVDQLRDAYAQPGGCYEQLVVMTGGQPWGPHASPQQLIPADQDIQILVNKAGWYLGLFDNLNNHLKAAQPDSNEALMIYVDSDTLVDPTRGVGWITGTMLHESIHMSNFYQRAVLMNASFETWLEETSAVIAQELTMTPPGTPVASRSPDPFFSDWLLRGLYGSCPLTTTAPLSRVCYPYDGYGAFGGFLLRQYGLAFYLDLRHTKRPGPDDTALVDAVIRKYDPQSGFAKALRRWGASSLALLGAQALPAGYGFPERLETANGLAFFVPELAGPDYTKLISYPAAFPRTLIGFGHAALRIAVTGGSLDTTVTVPPKSSLTVVIN